MNFGECSGVLDVRGMKASMGSFLKKRKYSGVLLIWGVQRCPGRVCDVPPGTLPTALRESLLMLLSHPLFSQDVNHSLTW